jgi:hypothetical protein
MSPKRKIFITILLVLGSLIVVLVFGIAPLIQGISKDERKFQTQKQELEVFKEETQEIENFAAFSQEKHQDVEGLELLFVSPETPIPLIEFLEQSSLLLGIELTIIPGEATKLTGDFWPSLELRVSSKAAYPLASAFLKAMENAPFATEISSVTMEAQRESRNVEFTFVLKAYTK